MTSDFEWDEKKNRENHEKHAVDFMHAQRAFQDPHRLIVRDTSHSDNEERWFCVGDIKTGIVTVRFHDARLKNQDLRCRLLAQNAQNVLPAERTTMKKLEPTRQVGEIAQYEDDPFALGEVAEGEMVIVKDFLPPPEELVLREPATEKITIALSRETVTFFGKKHGNWMRHISE